MFGLDWRDKGPRTMETLAPWYCLKYTSYFSSLRCIPKKLLICPWGHLYLFDPVIKEIFKSIFSFFFLIENKQKTLQVQVFKFTYTLSLKNVYKPPNLSLIESIRFTSSSRCFRSHVFPVTVQGQNCSLFD